MSIPNQIGPTPLAKAKLNIAESGEFDLSGHQDRPTYKVKLTPSKDDVQHRGTVHGGFIAAVFDDTAGMLAYHVFGIGGAVTNTCTVDYQAGARPGKEMTFEVYLATEGEIDIGQQLCIKGHVFCGNRQIASLESLWTRRKAKGA